MNGTRMQAEKLCLSTPPSVEVISSDDDSLDEEGKIMQMKICACVHAHLFGLGWSCI